MMGGQHSSSQGIGLAVAAVNRTVSASTASTPATPLTKPFADEVSVFARATLKTTSALVKGLPSWKVTPRRSSISQVSGSSRFQLTASPGSSRPCQSYSVRYSKTSSWTQIVNSSSWP
jgi:hypothetical protein